MRTRRTGAVARAGRSCWNPGVIRFSAVVCNQIRRSFPQLDLASNFYTERRLSVIPRDFDADVTFVMELLRTATELTLERVASQRKDKTT